MKFTFHRVAIFSLQVQSTVLNLGLLASLLGGILRSYQSIASPFVPEPVKYFLPYFISFGVIPSFQIVLFLLWQLSRKDRGNSEIHWQDCAGLMLPAGIPMYILYIPLLKIWNCLDPFQLWALQVGIVIPILFVLSAHSNCLPWYCLICLKSQDDIDQRDENEREVLISDESAAEQMEELPPSYYNCTREFRSIEGRLESIVPSAGQPEIHRARL